ILGDNIFYGHSLSMTLQKMANLKSGGCIFGYWVADPQRYGVFVSPIIKESFFEIFKSFSA
ncbi:unnamed protein product, partial [marine sediment metagenome]